MAQKANGRGGKPTDDDPVVVKKYANRRLYNTASSTYVTLEDLSDMVKEGVDFVVYDAKSGDDITRAVLTQIIFEEESRGQNLLPVQFLRRLIRFYGDSLQSFVPSYLEMSMEAFAKQRDQMSDHFSDPWSAGAMDAFQDQARKNMELFNQAMRMFTPFPPGEMPGGMPPNGASMGAAAGDGAGSPSGQGDGTGGRTGGASGDPGISELREQMQAMQEQLAALAKAKSGD